MVSFYLTSRQELRTIIYADGQALFAITSIAPYQIDTLLQMAEMSNQQGDPGQGDDFLNRALYAFEKSFAPTFQVSSSIHLD